jgi:multicomponent Na+:H+ antiporter subunit A
MSTHLSNHQIHLAARLSALLPLALFAAALGLVPGIMAGSSYRAAVAWVPALGVDLSLMIDGLSLLFVLIITGIGFFVSIYSVDYLHGHARTGRFFFFLHAFMLSMLGLVTADNAIALFVFWELTTIFSYLLIGFEHEHEKSRKSARQALLVTGAGGLALLAGFLLLQIASGTYEISQMVNAADDLQAHQLYTPILVLLLAGAFTKSAQFPFHFWLPNAMAAPSPVSAFLHSATMVKGGIYLLARFHPIMGGTAAWEAILVIVGGFTAVLGAFTALGQTDLKKILAYTTVAGLGIMTMLLGGQSTPSMTAVLTFLLVHALYKSALFLVAGIIDHQTGTREIDKLDALARSMPFTGFAAFAACLSMAGFPLFFGFIGKEIMYKGVLAETMMPGLAASAAVLANGLMTAVAGVFLIRPFLSDRAGIHLETKEAGIRMWSGPMILGMMTIFFGVVPEFVGRVLINPAVNAIHEPSKYVEFAIFHGINDPLALSVLTLAIGAALYVNRQRVNRVVCAVYRAVSLDASQLYENMINAVAAAGKAQNRILQNGSLHRYFFIVVAAFFMVTAFSYIRGMQGFFAVSVTMPPVEQALLLLVILAAVAAVVITRSVLLAICSLGVVGAGIAIVFLTFGAPDLALTQLLVETLTVIIVSIILLRLPSLGSGDRRGRGRKFFDGVLAAATGILVTTLMLTVLSSPLDRSLTDFFEKNSYLAAHGKNIVNVILVDFRSFDTLGEIIVVAAAGIAGYALIRRRRHSS